MSLDRDLPDLVGAALDLGPVVADEPHLHTRDGHPDRAWAKERLAAYKYPRVEPEPDHVLVQSAASDAESASAFHEPALAHVWTHIPPEQPHKPGQREVLMRFLLDRRRLCAPGLARARDTTGQRLLRSAP